MLDLKIYRVIEAIKFGVDPELLRDCGAAIKELIEGGIIQKVDGRYELLDASFTTGDEEFDNFVVYQFEKFKHHEDVALELIKSKCSRFFGNIEANFKLSEDQLAQMRLDMIEVIMRYAKRSTGDNITHVRVNFLPYKLPN